MYKSSVLAGNDELHNKVESYISVVSSLQVKSAEQEASMLKRFENYRDKHLTLFQKQVEDLKTRFEEKKLKLEKYIRFISLDMHLDCHNDHVQWKKEYDKRRNFVLKLMTNKDYSHHYSFIHNDSKYNTMDPFIFEKFWKPITKEEFLKFDKDNHSDALFVVCQQRLLISHIDDVLYIHELQQEAEAKLRMKEMEIQSEKQQLLDSNRYFRKILNETMQKVCFTNVKNICSILSFSSVVLHYSSEEEEVALKYANQQWSRKSAGGNSFHVVLQDMFLFIANESLIPSSLNSVHCTL